MSVVNTQEYAQKTATTINFSQQAGTTSTYTEKEGQSISYTDNITIDGTIYGDDYYGVGDYAGRLLILGRRE